MIIGTATLSYETQADRDHVVALTTPVQQATRDELGCLAYCFGADPVEPTHVQVYELWTDPQNLAKHFDHLGVGLRGEGVVGGDALSKVEVGALVARSADRLEAIEFTLDPLVIPIASAAQPAPVPEDRADNSGHGNVTARRGHDSAVSRPIENRGSERFIPATDPRQRADGRRGGAG